jgi:hypothetical protein
MAPELSARFGPSIGRAIGHSTEARTGIWPATPPWAVCHAFRDVLANNGENTGSTLIDAHFGHLIRLRSRSVIPMISENVFWQVLQRKS